MSSFMINFFTCKRFGSFLLILFLFGCEKTSNSVDSKLDKSTQNLIVCETLDFSSDAFIL